MTPQIIFKMQGQYDDEIIVIKQLGVGSLSNVPAILNLLSQY